MRRDRFSTVRRPSALFAAALLALAGCTFPGLKVEDGGSDAWKADGATYDKRNNHGKGTEIREITPEVIARLGHKRNQVLRRNLAADVDAPSSAAEPYRVGAGDALIVVVWGHPDLTNPAGDARDPASAGQMVRSDGSFFYPHVGLIQVAGLTVEEIRSRIATGLARVVKDPQVDVRVSAFRSQHVYVVGDVAKPCRLPITDQAITVLDALNACESIRPAVTHRKVTLQRGGRSHVIDLNQIYRRADAARSLTLQHGDQVYVEDGRWNRIFVIGEVTRQAALDIPISGMTLSEAVTNNEVGGLNLDSSGGGLYVIRGLPVEKVAGSEQVPRAPYPPKVYYLNAKSADAFVLADQFHLQPRDVVFASSASLVSYNRAVIQLLPSLQTLIQTAILFDDE